MNSMGPRHAAEYLDWFLGMWPIALLSLLLTLLKTERLKRSYRERSGLALVISMICSGLISGTMALGAVALLPLFISEPTSGMEIGVAIFVNLFGFKGVDVVIRRLCGFSVVNLMDAEDINGIRESMTPEQQAEHARNCPFRCKVCEGGKECLEKEATDCCPGTGKDGA